MFDSSIVIQHVADVIEAVADLPVADVIDLADRIAAASLVLTCGNGGSMATAQHFAVDLQGLGVNAFALSDPAMLTRWMNDYGAHRAFVGQVRPGALVVAFSASGTSMDIVELLHDQAVSVVLVTSEMKELAKTASLTVKVKSADYEVIEDAHMVICHAVKKVLRERKGQ